MPFHKPYHSTLEKEIKKSASIINAFFDSSTSPDKAIPAEFIQNCRGIAFLSVVKAGFIWSGKAGTGLVVARKPDGSWSPPSGLGTAGVGFGAEIGAEVVDFMIILGSQRAVAAFKKGTQVSVGAGLDLALGPFGRAAAANVNAGGSGFSANYTYSRSKGLFAGVGLHGSTFLVRGEMNSRFYGRSVTPMEILSGTVPEPAGSCDVLWEALNRAGRIDQNTGEEVMIPRSMSSSSSSQRTSFNAAERTSSGNLRDTTHRQSSLGNLPIAEDLGNQTESDPRLSRFSRYKSEAELYAEFAKRKDSTDSTKSSSSKTPEEPSNNVKIPEMPAKAGPNEKQATFELVMSVMQQKCPKSDLQVFKDNCRLYGQNKLSLDSYFSYLSSLKAEDQRVLQELIPQLVKLLPTEDKRNEVWQRYVSATY